MNVYSLPTIQLDGWHAEPRLLLAASVVMLSACGGGSAPVTTVTAPTTPVSTPVAASTCTTSVSVTCAGVSGGTDSGPNGSAVTVASVGLLTDTGIAASRCFAAGNDMWVSCTSAAAIALNDKQDGMVGRDVTTPNNADGKLGFSYSTVPNPAGGSFDVTECVKDNITGLIWEGKTATGTRAGSAWYTNYDNTAQAQFLSDSGYVNPTQMQIDAATNAVGYKNAVNTSALCGYTDWRLPTVDELQSLVDYSVARTLGPIQSIDPTLLPETPTIDTTWFPNTPPSEYLSSSGNSVDSNSVQASWQVSFTYGNFVNRFRWAEGRVRLVR